MAMELAASLGWSCQISPGPWESFKEGEKQKFMVMDSACRSRNISRCLSQNASVLAYINLYRNAVNFHPKISEDEKLNNFCSGQKAMVSLQPLISRPDNIDHTSRIALNA